MREINTHKTSACNDQIGLTALDERGPGNANHVYGLTVNATEGSFQDQVRFRDSPETEK